MGDGIQAAKAGILEIGDVYVVNKADRDGALTVKRDLRSMLSLSERPDDAWRPPVLATQAHSRRRRRRGLADARGAPRLGAGERCAASAQGGPGP